MFGAYNCSSTIFWHFFLYTFSIGVRILFHNFLSPCLSSAQVLSIPGDLRLPEDDVDTLKHVGVRTLCEILLIYTECPTCYQTRHFFNNFTTNEYIIPTILCELTRTLTLTNNNHIV